MEHERIVATRVRNGQITHVKLEDGREMKISEAIEMALTGDHFVDYVVGYSKYGTPYLRALPDDDMSNNLSDLPEF